MNKNLTELEIGKKGVVKEILLRNSIRRRIGDIGLIDNTIVECLMKSPGGDPIAYFIRGAVIALRNEDACLILIE